MLVKDRKQLTRQALVSLGQHTQVDWNLTIVDDCSRTDVWQMLCDYCTLFQHKTTLLTMMARSPHSGCVGGLKNLGVELSARRFGRGEWLYLSDNDVYFTEHWAEQLIAVAKAKTLSKFRLFGGQNHPYHHPIDEPHPGFCTYGAVAGTSWLMPWNTWDNYGPLDANAPGVGQSEDTAFCNRITSDGYLVGAMNPAVVLDTGITQTDGSLSVGHEVKRKVRGVLFT